MPSKNKPKDHAVALAKALEGIRDLELDLTDLRDLVDLLRSEIKALRAEVKSLANRPDPWCPIGPRPNQPNPFREPPLPWVTPRPAPGQPNTDRFKITHSDNVGD